MTFLTIVHIFGTCTSYHVFHCANDETHVAVPCTPIMDAPDIPGYTKAWIADFNGPVGSLPSPDNWAIETPLTNNNGEHQRYTNSPQNVSLDGSGQLLIAPQKTPQGTWTSARMHGKHSIACSPGHKMIFSARFRTGQNSASQQQGIWPAFWTLGDSVNHGVPWPTCCEWDIFEWGNGKALNQGTLHQTGVTGQHEQASGFVGFDHGVPHTWAVVVDLTDGDYGRQSLQWTVDGREYWRVQGKGGSEAERKCWERCAHQAFFPILNVAVGGNFVGDPNGQTMGGVGSGLTVQWVAVYKSV